MDPALRTALKHPDFNRVMLLAVEHADATIRKYIWRGLKPKASLDNEVIVDGKTAKDFVNEALRRLCDATRTYHPSKSLLENLNSITDSLIWSAKKSSDRSGIVDFLDEVSEGGTLTGPISTAVAPTLSADKELLRNEIATNQQKCFQLLRASFDGDKEMQDYLDALSEGYFSPADIAQLTGMPVAKVYELRRKVSNYAPKFFGVKNFTELERKIEEGNDE